MALLGRERRRVGREHREQPPRLGIVARGRLERDRAGARRIAAEERARVRSHHRDRERVAADAIEQRRELLRAAREAPAREELEPLVLGERAEPQRAEARSLPRREIRDRDARRDQHARPPDPARCAREEAAEQRILHAPQRRPRAPGALHRLEPVEHHEVRPVGERLHERVEALAARRVRPGKIGDRAIEERVRARLVVEAPHEDPGRAGLVAEAREKALHHARLPRAAERDDRDHPVPRRLRGDPRREDRELLRPADEVRRARQRVRVARHVAARRLALSRALLAGLDHDLALRDPELARDALHDPAPARVPHAEALDGIVHLAGLVAAPGAHIHAGRGCRLLLREPQIDPRRGDEAMVEHRGHDRDDRAGSALPLSTLPGSARSCPVRSSRPFRPARRFSA
jgi:hypothetical protein